MPSARPGYLISIEGIDGAGKTTQVAALTAALRARGHDVVAVQPGGTAAGELILAALLQGSPDVAIEPWAEALLFVAGRVQLLHDSILPALERGAVVISDRYVDSTLAYQGHARAVGMDALRQLHRAACDDVWPDLTLWLDLPPAQAARRQAGVELPLDRIERSPGDFHAAVREGFAILAAAEPERIVRIDASSPVEEVSRHIEELVLERLNELSSRLASPAAH